ncbi:hypothetical protein [Streptomyces sp. S.PB5]|uniref:hypothetical protein n=1 Tax=Streptomyces sp. S.PB5 TaxID=3020844 RepID=UPI00339D4BA6
MPSSRACTSARSSPRLRTASSTPAPAAGTSTSGFVASIRKQVEQVLTTGESKSHVVHVPFSEPEGNMFGDGEWSYDGTSWHTDPERCFTAWRDVYRLIEGLHPDTRIAGPDTCILCPEVKGFLEFARERSGSPVTSGASPSP